MRESDEVPSKEWPKMPYLLWSPIGQGIGVANKNLREHGIETEVQIRGS